MSPVADLNAWRACLRAQFPESGVIYVGGGRGNDLEWFANHGVSRAIVAEADETAVASLRDRFSNLPQWQVEHVLVSRADGDTTFHHASNPAESGLVPPETLRPLWRNLRTRSKKEFSSVSLATLLERDKTSARALFNWMVVDCLPAADILLGLGNRIRDFHVIECRAVVDAAAFPDTQIGREQCQELLSSQGFRQIGQWAETHPGFTKLLFVRDFVNQTNQFESLTAEHKQLTAGRDALAQEKSALTAERDALAKERDALSTERDTLTQAKAAADKQAAERQSRIEALTAEHKQLTAARDALAQEKAALTAERDALTKEKHALSTERDTLKQQLQSREAAAKEHTARQQMMHEEMVRAEAQLDLIKDMLLREPGL